MTAAYAPIVDPTKIEGRRICAWSIDLAIFLALFIGVLAATGGVSWTTTQFPSATEAVEFCDSFDTRSNQRGCIPVEDEALVVDVKGSADGVWLFNFVAYVIIQGATGGSIGKLLMGLRVVDVHGNRAGMGKSFLRTLLWIVDAFTCGIPILGGVLMVSTTGHRRVGDMAAGTFVVRKASVGSPVVIPDPLAGYGYGPAYPPPGPIPPPVGWAAPTAPGVGTPAIPGSDPALAPYLAPTSFTDPTSDGPHWDEARDTYIQYDRAVSAWLQWDEKLSIWRPIEQ